VNIHDAFLWLRCHVNSKMGIKFRNKWFVLATVSKSRHMNDISQDVKSMGWGWKSEVEGGRMGDENTTPSGARNEKLSVWHANRRVEPLRVNCTAIWVVAGKCFPSWCSLMQKMLGTKYLMRNWLQKTLEPALWLYIWCMYLWVFHGFHFIYTYPTHKYPYP